MIHDSGHVIVLMRKSHHLRALASSTILESLRLYTLISRILGPEAREPLIKPGGMSLQEFDKIHAQRPAA